MTTNTQLLPTDAEILDEARAAGIDWHKHWNDDDTNRLGIFARAVLARWGQPAHSGEPVGYLYCGGSYGGELADWEIVAEQLQCDRLNEHQGSLGKEAKLPLYTAPQPVGREPMTPEQRDALWESCKYDDGEEWTVDWEQIVDAVELHHGIKKGANHD